MNVPEKSRWTATSSSGNALSATDSNYSTSWVSEPETNPWLKIDLGEYTTLGGLEIYWGKTFSQVYRVESSLNEHDWTPLCATRHGEGGQNVFAFPAITARYVRWSEEPDQPTVASSREIVEINLYSPEQAMSVEEPGMLQSLGHAPVTLKQGQSITVNFGYPRSPLAVLIEWGKTWGTKFSVHLSEDGHNYREVGRISTGNGDCDNFYWRTTTCQYFRLTLHEASDPNGAIINEIKLRILNKDRMPISQLAKAAKAGSGQLYPQSLLDRQVYWTVLGEIGHPEEALFDEYGNLEPQTGFGQLMPLVRKGQSLHGAPACQTITQNLQEGVLPIPKVEWTIDNLKITTTALAKDGQATLEYRIINTGQQPQTGALVLTLQPVQINPYWQHGGYAPISNITVKDRELWVNDQHYANFSSQPATITLADYQNTNLLQLIETAPCPTAPSQHSEYSLLSAALEFPFELAPGASIAIQAACPIRQGISPNPDIAFDSLKQQVADLWRQKIGTRKITVGDTEVSDTVEAQTVLILLNATQYAFKPGPRNYDRTWIRDGSSQALALLYAGLIEDAKTYVLWYAERIYPNGLVPPILNKDGTINTGYGSDIEFDAQGEFVAIAADTYRLSRDQDFLKAIFEPVTRATRFIEELSNRTSAIYGPETRFHGLMAPSISHEGYNKPSYSYWDNFFGLHAYRNCEFLAREINDSETAEWAHQKGDELATNLSRSMRMTTERMGTGLIYGSADREDFDPTSTSIAFEPCRAETVLPADCLKATYDRYLGQMQTSNAPEFDGCFTPYEIRNINAFIGQNRFDNAFELLSDALRWRRPTGWRHWAEVVWGNKRAPEYLGDMPHTWIGAEFATAIRRIMLRENGNTLELLRAVPDHWWHGQGIELNQLPTLFGTVNLKAQRLLNRVTIELQLEGPAPEKVTVRYPGAQLAYADGKPVEINDSLITTPLFKTLEIEI